MRDCHSRKYSPVTCDQRKARVLRSRLAPLLSSDRFTLQPVLKLKRFCIGFQCDERERERLHSFCRLSSQSIKCICDIALDFEPRTDFGRKVCRTWGHVPPTKFFKIFNFDHWCQPRFIFFSVPPPSFVVCLPSFPSHLPPRVTLNINPIYSNFDRIFFIKQLASNINVINIVNSKYYKSLSICIEILSVGGTNSLPSLQSSILSK